MTNEMMEPGHGNSPAAWTAVIIMLVAFVIGTIAFFLNQQYLVWGSAGLLLAGLVVGGVMARLGYGVDGSKSVPKEH